jgi:hypothetical protein
MPAIAYQVLQNQRQAGVDDPLQQEENGATGEEGSSNT